MMEMIDSAADDSDQAIDAKITHCLDPDSRQSFCLFAGAGSGKTRSLVNAVNYLRTTLGHSLRLRNQKVAVITYTNAARDEIIRRTECDPVIAVATIHHFAWTLIEGFNHAIGKQLRVILTKEIADLAEKQAKGKSASKSFAIRATKITLAQERLERLATIRSFVYGPDSGNSDRDGLNHNEVLAIASHFIKNQATFQQILCDGYPYIFVDESQDTNTLIVDALFSIQKAHNNKLVIGLFGDMMQRIYGGGDPNLASNLPTDWAQLTKQRNFRCPQRVVALLNTVRNDSDQHVQQACSTAVEGHIRVFVLPDNPTSDQSTVEQQICRVMAQLTNDPEWSQPDAVKALILEHHMAAKRMGFAALFEPLYAVDAFRPGLLDGSLSLIHVFAHLIRPLWRANDDPIMLMRIVRAASPLISTRALEQSTDQAAQMAKARDGVASLFALLKQKPHATFRDVAENIVSSGLFTLPDLLTAALAGERKTDLTWSNEKDEDAERDKAIATFLAAPFRQVDSYADYVASKSRFATHHGVKGLEFPRVMVIIADTEARGWLFKYNKLLSTTKQKNQKKVKVSAEDEAAATRRLFYVTCSRAQQSLALVVYTPNPAVMINQLKTSDWFDPEEIVSSSPLDNLCGAKRA